MVATASEATRRYRRGIERVGIDAWRQAARAGNVEDAARALQRAAGTGEALTIDRMAQNYREAYSGAGGGRE